MFTFFFLSDSRRRRRHAPSRGPTSTCARAELNAAQEERVGEEEEVAVPTTAGTNVWLAIRFSCDPLFLSLIPRKPSFRSFGGFGGGDRETKRSLSLSLPLSGSASLATEVREREGKVTACDDGGGGDQRSPAVQSWAGSSGEGEGRTAELKWLEWKWRRTRTVGRRFCGTDDCRGHSTQSHEHIETRESGARSKIDRAAATTFNMNRAKEEEEAEGGVLQTAF